MKIGRPVKRSVSDDQVEQQYPCAYIDGSYDRLSHRFSYGAVIMTAPGCEEHFSKAFEDPALADMRNVAGEIKGSEFAISYALEQGWPKISIYYDYSGIEKWAMGEWKRNLFCVLSECISASKCAIYKSQGPFREHLQ